MLKGKKEREVRLLKGKGGRKRERKKERKKRREDKVAAAVRTSRALFDFGSLNSNESSSSSFSFSFSSSSSSFFFFSRNPRFHSPHSPCLLTLRPSWATFTSCSRQSTNRTPTASFQELCQYVGYGTEGSILILRTFLDYLNINKKDLKKMQLEPLLGSVFKYVLDKPNFSTVLSESLRGTALNENFLENLSNKLCLSACEKIGIGLALSDSENSDLRTCGVNYCMAQIGELLAGNLCVNSVEQIQNIFMFLHRSEGLSKHLDSFMKMASSMRLKEGNQFILSPLLPDELLETTLRKLDLFEDNEDEFDSIILEMEKEMSMADIMKELGYGCTAKVPQCKEILSLFLPLTEIMVSKILGAIAQTHSEMEDNYSDFSTFCSALGCSLSDMPSLSSWNIDVLIDSINQLAPGINWMSVFESLDHEGFYFPDEAAFSFFMSVYRHTCKEPFPLHTICGSVWKNTEGQLSFLKYAVSVPPEVFNFAHSARQLAYFHAVFDHKFRLGHANHAWLCLELFEVLCQLAERGHVSDIRPMLKDPLEHCPEVLLLGMAHINTAYNLLQNEITSTVLPMMLQNGTASVVAHHLWHVNPNLLLRGFLDTYDIDPSNMCRILDICQELKIVLPVLDMVPSYFGIRLATLASQKELIDMKKWLISNLSTYKDIFFAECLKLLKEIQFGISQGVSSEHLSHSCAVWKLYSETSPTILKVLRAHKGLTICSQISHELEKLHITFMNATSRMKNYNADNLLPSDLERGEEAANSYFYKMFAGELTTDEMIKMLVQLKESNEKREQSILKCIISNLFEEYDFFSMYPEEQLKLTAILFGSLVKHRIVTDLTLGIALQGVLDALHKPADSKMFMFGTIALEQFVDHLIELPQYCNLILQIAHLRATHSELVAFAERALSRISSGHSESDLGHNADSDQQHGSVQATSTNMEVPVSSSSPIGSVNTQLGSQISSSTQRQQRHEACLENTQKVSVSSSEQPCIKCIDAKPAVVDLSDAAAIQKSQSATSASAAPSSSSGFSRPSKPFSLARFGSALNIETLVAAAEKRETPSEAPASEIQENISFMINNLSAANIEAKAKEFTEILKEQYYPWFAQYMVIKRASIEPNFHDLYLKFLDKVNSKTLQRDILQATYENCKVLLGSELIKSSSEERSLLKNLGSWLGKITIGKNQVLRAREIDPKSLIIQAYEKGLMIAVIPFTSKILEPCPSSLAYRPPNPWTMSILQLLAEIHAMPSLKMNLKFDIEVLFKNLDVDLKAEPPTSLLKDRIRKAEGNPDFSSKDARQQIVGAVNPGMPSTQNGVQLPHDIGSPSHPSGHSSLISQHPVSLQVSSATATEEKVLAVALSHQLPSVQGLLQQLPISDSQLQMSVSNIEQQITVNPKLHALGLHLQFQRAIPIAIDKAIKEVVSNIVQRTFSIASQTTREMISKDFAMELDEIHLWNVVHLMVASLAASLAYIACKGHLRRSVTSQLRVSLQDLNIASELLEQAVQLVTDDNLDLGCALIVHAAKNKAIQSIDGEIGQQLAIRRKHIEDVGPKYFNSALHTKGHAGIYEESVWLPWLNQSKHSSKVPSVGSSASSAVSAGVSNRLTSSSGKLNAGLSSSGSRRAGFNADAEPFYLVPEWSSSLHSVPSPFTSATGRVGQQQFENDAIGASLPSASAPETLSVETSNNTEEMASSSQPLISTSAREPPRSSASEPLLTTGEALEKYQIISEKVETLVTNGAKVADIQAVILEVPEIFLRCVSRDEAALAVAQKVFRILYENASDTVHVAACLAVLAAIRDASKLVVKELTSWVLHSYEDRKFNKDITIGLIRHELLNLAEYNVYMAKMVDAGKNSAATEFAISLIETLLVNDSRVISELHDIIEVLSKLAAAAGSPKSLQYLVEVARNPAAYPTAVSVGEEDDTRQAPGYSTGSREDCNVLESEEPDLDGFYEKVTMLFAEWHKITSLPGANDATYALYALKLQQSGMLKGDDNLDNFFHWLMKLSVSHCLASEMISSGTLQSEVQPISYLAIDLYAKLVFSIIKFFPPEQGSNNLSLLPKILDVIVKNMQKDAEEKKLSFDPRPYFRLFSDWLLDLISLDPICDVANFQVLAAFANAFHVLQPLKVPGFSFAWIELVSHRNFMPKLLTGNAQKGWPYMQHLLVDLFQFLEPFMRKPAWPAPVQFLYKGTLRVLLVLKHDFPEFLSSYHFSFCDVIPQSCIQMRNIILSACPHNMRIPDPFTANLKIDPLVELTKYPCILSDVDAALREKQIKGDIDEYLKTRQQGSSFLTELKQKLLLLPRDASQDGTRYNVPVINSLVLYLGMQDVRQLQARTANCTKSTASNDAAVFLDGPALDIFRTLLLDLDSEGCYLVLSAMANQLRYPNDLTSYFAVALLHIFYESNQEAVQERITRVLSERLIVREPHPWGVLVTFLELIKNPKYNFWSRSFTRCAPEEIMKFFQSVSRGRAGPIPENQAGSSGRPSDNMN